MTLCKTSVEKFAKRTAREAKALERKGKPLSEEIGKKLELVKALAGEAPGLSISDKAHSKRTLWADPGLGVLPAELEDNFGEYAAVLQKVPATFWPSAPFRGKRSFIWVPQCGSKFCVRLDAGCLHLNRRCDGEAVPNRRR